jgi:tetratricopeptide (TPR) repeat protein
MPTPHKDTDLYDNAMAAFAAGDFQASITQLNAILAQQPAHKLALVSRGAAHMHLGRYESAIADFDQAIAHHPRYARAHHLRGLVRAQQKDAPAALEDFNTAIAIDPEYGAAYFSRATLHDNLGDPEAAAADAQMVAHLTNRNIEAFANENNIWRSQHLATEQALESELDR